MTLFITSIYGAIFISVVYLFVRMFYSVEYTPGTTVIYNSPIAQALFPNEPNKLFPTWGYDKLGRMMQDPTKYGQNGFWPASGPGFKPTASASGGPSPSGGMRSGGTGPTDTVVGWWKGDITYPSDTISSIYDDAEIPEKTVTAVGWWGDE